MSALRVFVQRLDPAAILPKYATAGAACFDLHALLDWHADDPDKPLILSPGSSVAVRTGLAFQIPAGHVMHVFSRSGHGFRAGVRLVNAVGVIDSDYRGEVQVGLHNDSRKRFQVKHGERIAQAMVLPIPAVELFELGALDETARGTGGFGSTGA
ncbi:MAG TPA: dUTP diphosphatase [Ramlibacter sp.]|nr:dUTP diphosphatase [Ramlibacter sp.]